MIKRKKKFGFKKGIYNPRNREKCDNKGYLEYRSSWELCFFKWCDNNPNVVRWGSENVIIPYISPIDKKLHRYFVDNTVSLREGDKIVKYLIEIKPSDHLSPPKFSKRKKEKTLIQGRIMYENNKAKWASATKWASLNNYKFVILTEKDLSNVLNK